MESKEMSSMNDTELNNKLSTAFNEVSNGSKTVPCEKLNDLLKEMGETIPGFKLRDITEKRKNQPINMDDFIILFRELGFGKGAIMRSSITSKSVIKTGGHDKSADGTVHSTTEIEQKVFGQYISRILSKDDEFKKLMPITPQNLFEKLSDGVIYCKLINAAVSGTIDERAINKGKLTTFTKHENLTLVLNSASAIGCHVINISSEDLLSGVAHLSLGLIWQIIRIQLLKKINLKDNPYLACLLEPGETIQMLNALSAEELLIRWVNYQLKSQGITINNLTSDIKDSMVYAHLLQKIYPSTLPHNAISICSEQDLNKRATQVLLNADAMDCAGLLTEKDIVTGNPKLNLAFIANLFNLYPNLEECDNVEVVEETREEKTYRNWINSLGVKPFVNYIYNDLSDGLVLFQLIEILKPGCFKNEKVNRNFKPSTANMQKLENCNYAIEILKNELKLSIVGIAGDDIVKAKNTPILAIVWQMMHSYTIQMLQSLSGSSTRIRDEEIVQWANNLVQDVGVRISSFKDQSISTSFHLVEVVDKIKSGSIKRSNINSASNDEEKLLNAQYVISVARKCGVRIYALPEDVVEVKPKMVMTIYACLMAFALKH